MIRHIGSWLLAAAAVAMGTAPTAQAETIKIGIVNTYTGPQASFGEFNAKGMKLYLKLHAKDLPPGVDIELLERDDGGPNPEKAKQLAQDLIVRDKVQMLAGAAYTPIGLAMAQVANEAKMPFVITNAGTAVITTRSPYVVRFSFTLQQSIEPLAAWAGKRFKTAYTLVSDYSPGHDSEQAFAQTFKAAGGNVLGSVRVPVQTDDFAPYLQRVKDTKPEVLMAFVPAGKSATSLMKTFADLGLKDAGIKLIGSGDITPDEELPNMTDAALGVTTVYHYSVAADRPANREFIVAWKKEYGADALPNFVAVAAWDGMAAIIQVIKAQNGKLDAERSMALFKTYKNPDSPRGPIAIDPETRDIVQNEYLRQIRRVNGKLANVEIETVATALKDPWKEQQKTR
jgi:branched-chain amino acid transport system substrate-binding protein